MVVVDIHDYACVSFVPWGNLDGVVLFQDFECISQFFLEVRLTTLHTVSACLMLSCLTADLTLVISFDKNRQKQKFENLL